MNYREKIGIFIDKIYDCYKNRDYDLLKTFVHDDITFFSVSRDNLYSGIDEVMNKIKNQLENLTYGIEIMEYDVKEVSKDRYVVPLIIGLNNDNKIIRIRMMGIVFDENNSLKIYHLHVSTPYYLDKLNFDENPAYLLQERLKKQSQKMDELIESIPGGMFQCYNDKDLKLIQVSNGFLDLVGYTREELKEKFDDCLIRLINPDDYINTTKEMEKQLKISNNKLIEYRIRCKNGKEIWVLDKGKLIEIDGKSAFSCIIVDINDSKVVRVKLKETLERHQVIMNQTNDIIYEWNIKDDSIEYSSNLYKHFGSNYQGKVKVNRALKYDSIHPKDRDKIKKAIDDILSGEEFVETEVRIKDVTATHRWYRVRMSSIFNEYHEPVKVVGIIINIDDEIKQTSLLLKQAQEDSLTGLKNRNTVQREIQNRLFDKNHCGALLLIDIDNFKVINDTKGHLVGDAVLVNIATKMQQVFRNIDLIGRIGGDEFLIYVETNDCDVLSNRAAQLLEMIANLNIEGLKISCSIGIALTPQDGRDFNEIYRKADQALYYVKNEGKNYYAFYDEQKMNTIKLKLNEDYIDNVNKKIDRKFISINQSLIEYTFKLLYNAIDIEDTLNIILKTVGKQFNVSRVYIFENSDDDRYCSNTFEWCNEGIEPQKDMLQNLSYEEDIPGYLDNFNEHGIFYCQDISRLPKEYFDILNSQNIKSILQCAITDKGKIKGYLGFDECNSNRLWQQENIDNLIYISEIVSTFLVKEKAQERAIKESQNLKSVLDTQNSYVYIIDKDNYNLLWMNRLAQERAPDARLGQQCYKAYMGKDKPCKVCPGIKLKEEKGYYATDIYNSVIDIWVKSTASSIKWYGEDAILINCFDISEYKNSK